MFLFFDHGELKLGVLLHIVEVECAEETVRNEGKSSWPDIRLIFLL